MKWTLAVIGLLLLTACYKRKTQPREGFLLSGTAVDCATGNPLARVRLQLYGAKELSRSFDDDNELGAAITDDSGRFVIQPLADIDVQRYLIEMQLTGYTTAARQATREEITQAGTTFSYGVICLQKK